MSKQKQENQYQMAVGLSYGEEDENAPAISIKGENLRADEIVKLAQRYGVSIVEDSELAESLCAIDLDQEIPEELFEAVAIVLNQIGMSDKQS